MSPPDEQSVEFELDGFPVASKPRHEKGNESLEMLASEFAERTRKGDQPSVEDYARRYPHFADEIREVFPTVAVLEQWKVDKESECLRRNVPSKFPLNRLGDCHLIKEIGRGGMGIVFEAADERSGQRVAVKVLPWRFGSSVPRWRDRFLQEAETVTRLRHQNIVPIYRVGEQEGYFFYVMQLVNGVSLDHMIRQLREAENGTVANESPSAIRTGDWKALADLVNQAASALCFAHVRGVLHNDVKPGNLLLDADRRVLVTDFGLARRLEADEAEAAEGLSGTLRYMAPERFAIHADERSDVYSLGATLYELATLQPAFTEPDRQRLVELITLSEFTPPAEIVPDIPRPLETMILKAMAKEPADRYQSVAEFAADLMRFRNDQPIHAKRAGRFWRRCRKWLSRGG